MYKQLGVLERISARSKIVSGIYELIFIIKTFPCIFDFIMDISFSLFATSAKQAHEENTWEENTPEVGQVSMSFELEIVLYRYCLLL